MLNLYVIKFIIKSLILLSFRPRLPQRHVKIHTNLEGDLARMKIKQTGPGTTQIGIMKKAMSNQKGT